MRCALLPLGRIAKGEREHCFECDMLRGTKGRCMRHKLRSPRRQNWKETIPTVNRTGWLRRNAGHVRPPWLECYTHSWQLEECTSSYCREHGRRLSNMLSKDVEKNTAAVPANVRKRTPTMGTDGARIRLQPPNRQAIAQVITDPGGPGGRGVAGKAHGRNNCSANTVGQQG